MRHDEFEQHEQSAQEIIQAIGGVSDDVRVPPHFAARVMAKAEASTKHGRVRSYLAGVLLPSMSSGQAEGCHGARLCCCRGWRHPSVFHLVQGIYRRGSLDSVAYSA